MVIVPPSSSKDAASDVHHVEGVDLPLRSGLRGSESDSKAVLGDDGRTSDGGMVCPADAENLSSATPDEGIAVARDEAGNGRQRQLHHGLVLKS